MANLFTPRADLLVQACLGGVLGLAVLGVVAGFVAESPRRGVDVGRIEPQPVMFSHAHHVGELGLDCRYCHATAAVSDFAGMPTAETCMNCHLQLYTTEPMLEPVREAWAANQPIAWSRVYQVPDYVRFSHRAHVQTGVACVSCHGRMDEQGLTRQETPMTMGWCLDCHEHPGDRLVEMGDEFSPSAKPGEAKDGPARVDRRELLTNCSACHM